MKINTKEDIINYFQSGYKKSLLIGVENEKFLLEKDTSKRANYEQIKNILNYLKKFGWEEILEDINIIGEIYLDIEHQLAAGNKFNIDEAFAIASHPQALGQCSKWIERNIGNIKRLEMPSSAVAAKYAKENKNILCIVNSMAIKNYKLKLVKKNIQDYSENKTRFLVIGKNEVGKTGKDKSSFLIKHQTSQDH